MSWLKFDDTFPDHPKILAAGILAPLVTALQVRAVAYASRYLTNGHVPEGAIPAMVHDIEMIRPRVDWKQKMIDLKLWEPRENGVLIHDYLDYNPTKKKVLSDRKQRQLAGQAGGEANRKRLASRTDPPPAGTLLKQKGAGPGLAPVPSPKDQDHPTPTPSQGKGNSHKRARLRRGGEVFHRSQVGDQARCAGCDAEMTIADEKVGNVCPQCLGQGAA